MYIKNRRNSNKFKVFGSYQRLCLTESLVLRNRLLFIYGAVGYKPKKKLKQPLKIILLFLTLCSFELVNGQIYELKINKSKNSKLVNVLNNGVLIGKTNANYLLVKIYKVDNGSGSAKLEEGHERSFNLLVAISEFDEYPKQNVFEVGPFYNPEFVEWTEIKKYEREFTIKHGGVNNSHV